MPNLNLISFDHINSCCRAWSLAEIKFSSLSESPLFLYFLSHEVSEKECVGDLTLYFKRVEESLDFVLVTGSTSVIVNWVLGQCFLFTVGY